MAKYEWHVDCAGSRDDLQVVLNTLDQAGWEIFSVMTEAPEEGWAHTIVARKPVA